MTIHQLNLGMANVYIVRGERTVVVDTGQAKQAGKIARTLEKLGVAAGAVSLILLTHAHIDHAGSAQDLKNLINAPLACHPLEVERLHAGSNGPMTPMGLEARLLHRFIDVPYPRAAHDLTVDESTDLRAYGIAGKLVHTPGHTPGSLSVVMDDGSAIIGDLLRGGALGGFVLSHIPRMPYFLPNPAENIPTVRASVDKLLQMGAQRFYVGHGGPLSREAVAGWLARV
ncbi:MAG: MBL fold metallo-hydrolase [Anaerolineae bacterium]|jgi:glyoxylase-like metal-dependent hydrolase (beta-lactamase superfamily II)|nr:MBL fold metallo-hydrolase [Anaerolineae bacterium]